MGKKQQQWRFGNLREHLRIQKFQDEVNTIVVRTHP